MSQNPRSSTEMDGADTDLINTSLYSLNHNPIPSKSKSNSKQQEEPAICSDERLKNIDPKMVQFIMNEVFLNYFYLRLWI